MIIRTLLFIILSILLTSDVYAQSANDTFIVQTLVGSDTTPPTVPTGLTAIPVATTQIDLSWSSSTDNFLLSGYQVFRDDVQIATTTVTNYSDVGLTPSTTYTYYVTAFDVSNNISASSTPVATTTLASTTPPTPTPTTTPGTGGGGERLELTPLPLEIVSLEVIPGQTDVVIRYETRGYIRSIIKWGETISYELGSLQERSFRKIHETRISGLTPETRYQFTIEGENNVGRYGVLTQDSFVTLPPDDVFPPSNVRNLRAQRDGEDILLSWENPPEDDFSRVRIIGNDRFYPTDTADGRFVYEDDGEQVRDRGAAVPGTTQYYTVFSYDERGNISSGAIVALQITDDGEVIVDPIPSTDNQIELSLEDVFFEQDGEVLRESRGSVSIDGSKTLTVWIPYERLPENLKTVMVTLRDPINANATFSFLLRVDEKKERYTATLAPLGRSGNYPFALSVIDFETSQIGYVHGSLDADIVHFSTERSIWETLRAIFTDYLVWFVIFLLILLLLAYRMIYSTKRFV